MFWGLIIDSNKKYSQTIEKTFHVSMASLEAQKATDENVQVTVFYEGTSYLLCTLNKKTLLQQPLDLVFEVNSKISFSCNGNGRVHLTGYLADDEEDDPFNNLDGESDEEDEEEDEVPALVPIDKKRKNNGKENKAKKAKLDESLPDESDSDDEDFNVDNGLIVENSSDEDDDEDSEVGEDDDDDEDDDEDDDDEEDEEDEEEVKEKPAKNAAVVNGKSAKPAKEETNQNKKEKKNNSKTEDKSEPQQQQQQTKKRTIDGGVQIEDMRVGHGAPAKLGKFVGVYYIGRLKNGKKFDQALSGEGFKFRLGKGEVIKGWDVGIQGMKIGGKRKITIPPNMGYGARGSPPVIPPNSQLIFEVELRSVK